VAAPRTIEDVPQKRFYCLVPFPKIEGYIGKSLIREFIVNKMKDRNSHSVSFHAKVALHGLGGVG
jgi:hypothetical protein